MNSHCKHYILALVHRNQIGCAVKPVYGGAHENLYKVKFNCGSLSSALSQNKTKGKYRSVVVSQRFCPFRGRKG